MKLAGRRALGFDSDETHSEERVGGPAGMPQIPSPVRHGSSAIAPAWVRTRPAREKARKQPRSHDEGAGDILIRWKPADGQLETEL
jgi:hypothetical protein